MKDDVISRQAAIDAAKDWYDGFICGSFKGLEKRLEALPSAQPKTEQNTRSERAESDKLGVKMGETCTDTISRQAAIYIASGFCHPANVAKELAKLPSAQPEIVRCKECKHQEKFFHEDKRRKEGGYYIFGCDLAGEYSHVCLDDDFCSRAERRQDG